MTDLSNLRKTPLSPSGKEFRLVRLKPRSYAPPLGAPTESWSEDVVDYFRPRTAPAPTPPLQEIYLFDGVDQSTMWAQYFSTRILLAELLILVSRHLSRCTILDYSSHEAEWLHLIKQMSRDLAAVIPWVLGWVDDHGRAREARLADMRGLRAFTLLWPLRVPMTAEGVRSEDREYIMNALGIVGRDYGLGRALWYAELGNRMLQQERGLVELLE